MFFSKFLPALLLCALTHFSALATMISLPHDKFKLDNGLEVILQHDSRNPYVALSMWYHVGATEEKPGKTGFAHLFEHLMFQGTPHVGDDKHFAYLQEAGATVINGTTNFDRTNYFEVVPSNEIELALWLESDRMGWLMQGITQEKLDEQRGVVKNERRQRYDNQPYAKAEEKAWQLIFPKEHPYHGLIIGSMKDLDEASLDDVRAFFYRYYSPQNATLAIVGDYDQKTIRATIEKYFGTLSGASKPLPAEIKPAQIDAEIKLVEFDPLASLAKIQMQYLTPPIFSEGDANFDVISDILSGDKSSRLSRVLVYEKQLAQSVTVMENSLLSTSVFTVDVLLKKGVNPDLVIALIDNELQSLVSDPPSKQQITRTINKIKTEKLFRLQKIGGYFGKVEQLQVYNHYLGEADWLAQDLARYERVTPQSIVENVTRYLNPQNRIVLIINPKPPMSKSTEPT